ncbi:MAG: acyl carrier protein [Candidatus Marinimicrobia bacterium]|nr:acyl carrier protein [Candidatus Neomarinimicrobiota bacterium]
MSGTVNRVKKVVAEVLEISEIQIEVSSEFVGDLGADSMQSIELVAGFEEEFDIEMDEDDALGVQNVQDAVTFIEKYL